MATYGYAGDFSSDDDEKIEQIQERMVQTKFDSAARPNKKQIEETIEQIKRTPYDQDVNLTDEVLAGLLDYYKTQRGPIVDSTRKLYNKIALRLVRGNQDTVGSNDGTTKETNGNSQITSNNNNNNNNNSINVMANKGPSQSSGADTFSSDDEDIDPFAASVNDNAKKFDSRVVYSNNDVDADDDQMEVDPVETPIVGAIRESRRVDMSTDDDDDSSSGSERDDDDLSESNEELNSEPDVLEVTPIKPTVNANREKEAIEVLMAMRPSTPKQTESSTKRQPIAHSTPKESVVGTAKKPYTRSQRVATRSATRSSREASKVDKASSSSTSADVFLTSKRSSRKSHILLAGASVVVLVLAFLLYYFRSSIIKTAEPLFRNKITF